MDAWPNNILLATDGSGDAELAAATAVALSKETGSELHVVAVAEEYPHYDAYRPLAKRSRQLAWDVLDEQLKKIENLGGAVTRGCLRMGMAGDEVIVLAEEIEAGLIVMGSRGRGGLRRALMGSVSDSMVRHAHCPVMVVRGEPVSFPTKILLATDGSKNAELAGATAADLARSTGSELHVVSVFPRFADFYPYYEVRSPEAAERLRREAREQRQEMLDEQVERIREAGGDVAQTHIRTGGTVQETVTLAEEMGAGLVVMGSRGLGEMRRTLMGSVSDSVVRHAHCPVLIAREG